MEISVICPVLNEREYIPGLIDFFNSSAPPDKELILIDGGSTDGTVELIDKMREGHSAITLLHNPKKYVPFALNLAIPLCKGKYIVRLDAHSLYSPDYFEAILATFRKSGADIVGGPTRTQYRTAQQEAIAFAVSHPFGIGGSKVHDETYEGLTDSVTFGAWKREIFQVTGMFDEQLRRNQDDEFHYRARSKGLKIYQSPEIKLFYFPRKDLRGLFSQYFQYGLYKPLVLHKIHTEIKLRHLVPAVFVLYLACLILLPIPWFTFIPLIIYLSSVLYVSIVNNKSWSVKKDIPLSIFCIHLAYGSGFWAGLGKIVRI
ncbi:MAG: glycosyltransferase family 2 protein [Cyclobacteriaceae bacterium]|nr:glycosyltransferase family 2 protein [Cyclobacteriaceae bacterium]